MFRAVPLPIIRSFPLYIRHWYMSCSFWRQLSSTTCSCLKAVIKSCMTYTSAECAVENSWWWAEELPETCKVSWQKYIWEISASVGFIKKKCEGLISWIVLPSHSLTWHQLKAYLHISTILQKHPVSFAARNRSTVIFVNRKCSTRIWRRH